MRQPGDREPAPPELTAVQDLLNTVDLEERYETLGNGPELEAFCREHGLPHGAFTDTDAAAARQFREALRDACSAHAGHAKRNLSGPSLAELFQDAALLMHMDADGRASVAPDPRLHGLSLLTAHLAATVLTAEAAGTWQRLKACSNDVCRWAYYDRSPAGRSRWCAMSICGSRAKMRSYRSRSTEPPKR